MDIDIIKLGGSLITEKKKGKKVYREETVRRLAREIVDSKRKVVMVHGAGSFGHPGAMRYRLHLGYQSPDQLMGFAEVQEDMRLLNLKVINSLLDEGISAISIPPVAVVEYENGVMTQLFPGPFRTYLDIGLVPVTFGDAVPDEKLGFCICSGDDLVLHLAKSLKPRRAIFATDVDGIYDIPKKGKGKLLKVMNENTMKQVKLFKMSDDVTGGIARKIRTMLYISRSGVDCLLLNGNVKGRLRAALLGENVPCTRAEVKQ